MDCQVLLGFHDNDLALKLYCASHFYKKPKMKFSINKYSEADCKKLFRFNKSQISQLANLLQIPPKVTCDHRIVCYQTEALCILLRRMAYPNRLFDLTLLFGRSSASLSVVFNYMLKHILDRFEYLITDFDQWWLSNDWLRKYSDAVHSKGSPLTNCWGFIDGTVRNMCRPGRYQKDVYNGHKRVHALKYQSIVIPNGLIANLYGPVPGRRHDAYMLSESGIMPKLASKNVGLPDPFYLYGDPAYPLRTELLAPFKGSRLTDQQALFNKKMSMNRVAVEWMFGKILSNWAFVDYKKNQRLFLQPLAKYFKVAVLLTNIHTCFNGNQVSNRFEINPPDIEDYLILKH